MRLLSLILLIFGFLPSVRSSTCQISTESEANDFDFVYTNCVNTTEVNNTYPLNISSAIYDEKLNYFLRNKEVILGGIVMMHSTEIKRIIFPKLRNIGAIEDKIGNDKGDAVVLKQGNYSLQLIGNLKLKDLFFYEKPTFGGSVIVRGNRILSLKSINKLKVLFHGKTPCDLQQFHEYFCYASDIIEDRVKGCMLALGDFIFNEKNPLTWDHLDSFRSLRVVKGKIHVTASETQNIPHFSQIENITSECAGPALFISIGGLKNVSLSRLHHISSAGRNRLEIRNYKMLRKEYEQLVARLGGSEGLVVGVSEEEPQEQAKTEVWEASNLVLVLTCLICFLIMSLVLGFYVCFAIRRHNKQEKNEKAASQKKQERAKESQKTSQKSSGEKTSEE